MISVDSRKFRETWQVCISIISNNISSTSSSSGRIHGVIRVEAYVVFYVFRVWSCVGLVFSVFRVWSNVLVLLFVSCCDSRFVLVLVIVGLLVVGMKRTCNYVVLLRFCYFCFQLHLTI